MPVGYVHARLPVPLDLPFTEFYATATSSRAEMDLVYFSRTEPNICLCPSIAQLVVLLPSVGLLAEIQTMGQRRNHLVPRTSGRKSTFSKSPDEDLDPS